MRIAPAVVTLLTLSLSLVRASTCLSAESSDKIYANLAGEVLLENDRLRVEKFSLRPGQSTGPHSRAAGRLLVIIKGGVLASNYSHRATLWKDGSVFWQGEGAPDAGSTNIGTAPMQWIWVTPKPVTVSRPSPEVDSENQYLGYPNVPGEDLLENELLIVQRFVLKPGQWEGVHAHGPNSLYIFVRGGQWISRTYTNPKQASGNSPDGSVGWMTPSVIGEGHQSGNIGKHPSEVVWVILKK
jgi:predicted metal-dependent enzyme (double-stranded beta helix superfamily)